MPPFLPRKRSPPPASPASVPYKRARLLDALDSEATNRAPEIKRNKTFSVDGGDTDSDSSLSDIDSDQFEDVPVQATKAPNAKESEADSEDDENIEWEDAAGAIPIEEAKPHVPLANGPIQITLRKDDDDIIDYGTAAKAGNGKKGPSKREKRVRMVTHQLHVQFLLWHNAVRNNWIADQQVQDILVKQLPPQILREIEKWKRFSGLAPPEPMKKRPTKGKKLRRSKEENERSQRDWGEPSQRLEAGKPDMSHGDPLITLMKVLSAYWRKRFATTAPGLRKRGYGTKLGLKQDVMSLRNDEHDPERHGERIESLAKFRDVAKKAEGSRDVGAQLFTALLRGLGIEARLVASLQPSGYGFTKVEQMVPRKSADRHVDEDSSDDDDEESLPTTTSTSKSKNNKQQKPSRTGKAKPSVINLDTDLSDHDGDDVAEEVDIKDDDSVVDVTPSLPKQRKPKYDRDLAFPIYWTEAVSPITNKVLAVSPLVLENAVATTAENLLAFEPRGARAEKARQVMAYVVAYSADGTAKDVTVRYLRKHVWPGKTKGFRIPLEKIPVYDERGKVRGHADYDWFKHVLSLYCRHESKRTAVDDLEDESDLVPQQPERKTEDDGIDTLQSLKTSADYVLERFLRREEALRPGSQPVRTFVSGKGDKYKEEPVYRRSDVERCLTAESWHKEGRRPGLGETPMKMVPVRAVTLTRKREAEEHERLYGEKQTQGLYSWDQTEWIIPPPIKDGVIPKNAYGNMDCFVPSMVPKGAVHVPFKGTVRICKKLEIDFAEAVTGFEFGNKRAVPICTGVVVAKEHEKLVKDAWVLWNEEQRRKEDAKLEKQVLDLWRKFVLGLRIRERVQDMYGEELGVFPDVPTGYTKEDAIAIDDETDQGGGFVPDDEAEEEIGGGFLLPHEEEVAPIMEDLIMDDHHQASHAQAEIQDQQSTMTSPGPTADYHADEETNLSSDSDEGSEQQSNTITRINGSVNQHATTRQGKPSSKSKALNGRKHASRVDRTTTHRTKSSDSQLDSEIDNDTGQTHENGKHLYSNEDEASENEVGNDDDAEDDEDEDEDEDQEIYTPRATRTRGAKSNSNASKNSKSKTKALPNPKVASKSKLKSSRSSKGKNNRRVASRSIQDSDGKVSPEPSPALIRRGRGRPRENDTPAKINSTPSKRPGRLLRKESTLVTSPYFEA